MTNFKDKIQDKLTTLSDKQIYWLFAGILLVVFLLDFFVLMRPQLSTLNKINPKINLIKDDIQKAESDMQRSDHYRGEVARFTSEIDAIHERVLDRQEVPLILEKVSRIANENHIRIDQVMPDSINQELLLENEDRRYYVLPISMEAQSTYHDFGRFVNNIESEDIYLSVKDFKMASKGNSKKHLVTATLNAIVYEEIVQW